MTAEPRLIGVDLFCGAGGMSLGFEQAGFHVVGAVDSDPANFLTHCLNFPECSTLCADLAKLTGKGLRSAIGLATEIDVLFGGPPCQGFSWIGKRSARDPRNELVGHFLRMVLELRPRYFVIENVDGILYGAQGRRLLESLGALRRSGFRIVEPVRALNAKDYGVPQARKRVFVLGYRRDQAAPIYPIKQAIQQPTVWDAIGDLALVDEHSDLTAETYTGPLGHPSAYARTLRTSGPLTGCARTKHSSRVTARFARLEQGEQDRKSKFKRLRQDGLCTTLRSGTGEEHGSFTAARPIHPTASRCLTVREAARLHTFPDGFIFHPTVWHGFRQVGNSVPPLLARAVALCIRQAFESRDTDAGQRRVAG